MTRMQTLTPETATGAAGDLLADLEQRRGPPGPMVRTMAHSPAVLGGYLEFSKQMKRAKLARPISERISLAVQHHQGCALCLAAHTQAARVNGVDEHEISLARQGTSADAAIAAAVAFGLQVHTAPATITDAQIVELHRYGYNDREIADVVGVVALNVLTGAFNLVAGIEPEEPDTTQVA